MSNSSKEMLSISKKFGLNHNNIDIIDYQNEYLNILNNEYLKPILVVMMTMIENKKSVISVINKYDFTSSKLLTYLFDKYLLYLRYGEIPIDEQQKEEEEKEFFIPKPKFRSNYLINTANN